MYLALARRFLSVIRNRLRSLWNMQIPGLFTPKFWLIPQMYPRHVHFLINSPDVGLEHYKVAESWALSLGPLLQRIKVRFNVSINSCFITSHPKASWLESIYYWSEVYGCFFWAQLHQQAAVPWLLALLNLPVFPHMLGPPAGCWLPVAWFNSLGFSPCFSHILLAS